jgi:hypothetical protein
MNRLIFALALAPALIATGARAQTVSDDVAKELWCGVAWQVYYTGIPSVPPDQQPMLDAYLKASSGLVDKGAQGYLDGGYTEEALTKIKADLVIEVTPVVTGKTPNGKYSQDDCGKLLDPFVVPPPQPSSAIAPDMSSAPPPMDASSSAAQ